MVEKSPVEVKPRVLFVPRHDKIKVLVFDEGAGLARAVQNTVLLDVRVPPTLALPDTFKVPES